MRICIVIISLILFTACNNKDKKRDKPIILDTTPPQITIIGENNLSVEYGSYYRDAGATVDGNAHITSMDKVDTKTLGEYNITYIATDSAGNSATAIRTVSVIDTTPPYIKILGKHILSVEHNSTYIDEGATAIDTVDGDVDVTSIGNVDTKTLGDYNITYRATDSAGNSATAIRKVSVIDSKEPLITINGGSSISVEYNTTYIDAGATAVDAVDENVTITTLGLDRVNTNKLGDYNIIYVAVDSTGNSATARRIVSVIDSTTPQITIIGDNPQRVEYNSTYIDAGAIATDTIDGNVSVTTTGIGNVDTTTIGDYNITYTATDSAGNSATAIRRVSVRDGTPPHITIVGEHNLSVEYNSDYIDAGATAIDAVDGNVSVTTTGNVDTTTIGDYNITYTATDRAGNSATATRRVTILSITTIRGTITYDLVPHKSSGHGLDYNKTTHEKAKLVVVEAVKEDGTIIKSTTTDENGTYVLAALSLSTPIKIRVSAKMLKTGEPGWDVKVVDNTNDKALYVMEGTLASIDSTNNIRNLNAPSGWTGDDYTQPRVAAPFAILDIIESAMKKVQSADAQIVFPPLVVNWSPSNVAATGSTDAGQIGTSYYSSGNLYILGDAGSDTDEYDNHVIAHEWGHYYEDKFSRSDSIGGSHSGSDLLDIRVAFGEGWGNAFSAIALDDPIYFDTFGSEQGSGIEIDMESGTTSHSGWYNQTSVQNIIYDLYDSNDDGADTLSLGFTPIHQMMIDTEKKSDAFTSIFTFIKGMKDANSESAAKIDAIVSSENIAEISDIWGNGRTNRASAFPYKDLSIGTTISNVKFNYSNGKDNKLGNHLYYKVNLPYGYSLASTIKIHQTNGNNSNPNFILYPKLSVNPHFGISGNSDVPGDETQIWPLPSATHPVLLEVWDANNISDAEFDISINHFTW